ncbi:UNVERIFIED_CONTAM: hypothetical protein Slati_0194800 [Sesamum latifolium]|uniref:Uncharacterized protein n=1 Tax=Sesamum latifolium TaxID=2727402 RepID=A0AAW2YC78_9LAMI
MREMLFRVNCAIIFNNGRGAAICGKFVCHHCFGEGDALSFIFGGSSNLVLDVLEALLKAFEVGKPLWRNLLRGLRGFPYLRSPGGVGAGTSPSASSFGASTSDGVATRAGASVTICYRIAAETIC